MWGEYASRARQDPPRPPAVVAKEYAQAAVNKHWAVTLANIIREGLHRQENITNLTRYHQQGGLGHGEIKQHCTFILELLSSRGSSLATEHLLPPHRWAAALHPDFDEAKKAHRRVVSERAILLEAEQTAATCGGLMPLDKMHWRHNKRETQSVFD